MAEIVSGIYALSFYIIAFFAVVSALVVISARNPVISAVWLAVCFIAVAGIYVLLKAPFLAMVQILVYAGAVMVLFVMIIMLLDLGKIEGGAKGQNVIRALGSALGVVVMMFLVLFANLVAKTRWASWTEAQTGTSEKIGEILFTKYLLPFEILSLLLLAAVVSAIYLARRPEREEGK